jgi:hypothetical protein
MKPSLQVRLSQHLALTPQLQQSIRLLQLSTLELHQEVEQMLEQNPFLDIEEEAASPFETPAGRQAADRAPSARKAPRPAGRGGDARRGRWRRGQRRRVRHHRTRGLGERHRGDDFDGIRELPSAASGGQGEDDDRRARTAAPVPAACRTTCARRSPACGWARRPGGAGGADRIARRRRLPGRPAGRDRRAPGRDAGHDTAARRARNCTTACAAR